jgi:hypothetical protein
MLPELQVLYGFPYSQLGGRRRATNKYSHYGCFLPISSLGAKSMASKTLRSTMSGRPQSDLSASMLLVDAFRVIVLYSAATTCYNEAVADGIEIGST